MFIAKGEAESSLSSSLSIRLIKSSLCSSLSARLSHQYVSSLSHRYMFIAKFKAKSLLWSLLSIKLSHPYVTLLSILCRHYAQAGLSIRLQ